MTEEQKKTLVDAVINQVSRLEEISGSTFRETRNVETICNVAHATAELLQCLYALRRGDVIAREEKHHLEDYTLFPENGERKRRRI